MNMMTILILIYLSGCVAGYFLYKDYWVNMCDHEWTVGDRLEALIISLLFSWINFLVWLWMKFDSWQEKSQWMNKKAKW